MKKALKIILISILFLLLVVIGGGYLYLKTSFPKVSAAPDIKVEITPERIERGKYLANHVALCMDCHSERDWHKFSGPPIAGTEGIGGEIFDQNFGFPGAYYARNITPAGLGNWTDGEILRAMTAGVNKDGEPLFPVMPYMSFRNIPREDLFSIIAYLRTLDPIEKELPESKSDFPMNLIINMIPNDPDPVGPVSKDDKLAWGKVLSSACYDCHTPMKKGRPIKELAFSGGL